LRAHGRARVLMGLERGRSGRRGACRARAAGSLVGGAASIHSTAFFRCFRALVAAVPRFDEGRASISSSWSAARAFGVTDGRREARRLSSRARPVRSKHGAVQPVGGRVLVAASHERMAFASGRCAVGDDLAGETAAGAAWLGSGQRGGEMAVRTFHNSVVRRVHREERSEVGSRTEIDPLQSFARTREPRPRRARDCLAWPSWR